MMRNRYSHLRTVPFSDISGSRDQRAVWLNVFADARWLLSGFSEEHPRRMPITELENSMQHCLIWAVPRVGSTALAAAMGALNEPFHQDFQWSEAAEIERICSGRCSIKHIYEECPDELNIAIAHIARGNGYRHIRLVRRSEFARLVSRGIAAQLVAWVPETAAAKFAALRAGKAKLDPLDIDELMNYHRMTRHRWGVIRSHIANDPIITIAFEDITNQNSLHRRTELDRIARYLGLSSGQLAQIDRAMRTGGQDTQSVWELVPNIDQLHSALVREGVL